MQYSLFNAKDRRQSADQALPGTVLYIREADGAFIPANNKLILNAARDVAEQVLPERQEFNQPDLVKRFFALKLNSTLEHEVFAMAMLDSQMRLIEYVEPFRGTLTQASVYPREVIKMVLAANAAAVIIAHNHPSGMVEPSAADKSLTSHLRQALSLVDVRLLDHIIVGGNKTLSFVETGHL